MKTTKMKNQLKGSTRIMRERMDYLLHVVLGGLLSVVSFSSTPVFGEGFRNPPPGTFDLGRAGGRIAQVDDSSAVQHNPANLVDLAGTEFQFTPTIVYISADFKSPNGQSATSQNPWKVLPNVFGSTTLFDGKIAVGFGLTAPYGIGSEWDEKSSAFAHP